MEYNAILPTLTRTLVLSYVSQEEIMESYLGVKVQTSEQFCSPLRTDKNATCGFRYNTLGRLRMKDFSGDFWGDCFDVVARVIHRNASNAVDFNIILEDIAKRFKIHKFSDDPSQYTVDFTKKITIKEHKQPDFTTIQVVGREWMKHDAKFWTGFGINKYILQYFQVVPCKEVYVNGKPRYTFTKSDPCYAYYYGKDEHGRRLIKIYFPRRKRRRFITNTNILQGERKLADVGRLLIVTKSYKDIMSMRRFRLFGERINAVAPASESSILKPVEYNRLKHRFDYIVSLYDFDKLASIKTAYKMKDKYRIDPFFFTDGRYGTKDYGAKDFADYVKIHGVEAMNNLLQIIENYYEDALEQNELKLYKQMSWIEQI